MVWESFLFLLDVEQVVLLSFLAIFFLMFVWELIPVDLVAVTIILSLIFTGILDVGEALNGFGHPAVIGIGALFIVSEGLLRTGALGVLANHLESWSGGREGTLTVLILCIVAGASAFLNNTPVVAMFIPVVLGLSRRLEINPSHLLIPLSYAAILGGTCTLIGTSTNILVSSILEEQGREPLRLFEFFKLGGVLTVLGIVYLVVFGRRFLPDRQTITSLTVGPAIHEYVTELEIRRGGHLNGQKFGDTVLAGRKNLRVLQLIRGEEIIWPPFRERKLHAGDAVILAGKIEDIMELQAEEGLSSLEQILSEDEVSVKGRETELAEILVVPNSPYVGRNLDEAQIRSQFGVSVIAIQRHGMHLRKKLSAHPLRIGDMLLVQGTTTELERLGAAEGLVLMSGVEDVVVRKSKAPLAVGILIGVLVLLSSGSFHMATVALTAAVLMVLSGCLPTGKVYDSIHWRVLVLIAGTLALGAALHQTGTAELIARVLCEWFAFTGPAGLVVVTLVLSALLTECISNTAVAAVMVPIALQMPSQLAGSHGELSYLPFVMAVAFGASCSFLTPIGYQTNALVYGAGGYRFGDFIRLGLPLVLVVWTIGGFLIPRLWPLYI